MKTLSLSVGRTPLAVVLVGWAVLTSTTEALTVIAPHGGGARLSRADTATAGGRLSRTSTTATTPTTTLWGTASSSSAAAVAVAAVGTTLGLRFPPIVPFGKHAPVFVLPEDEDDDTGTAADTAKHILGGKGANLAEMSQLSLRYGIVIIMVSVVTANGKIVFTPT